MVKTVAIMALIMVLSLVSGAAAKTAHHMELKQIKPKPVVCKLVVTTRKNIGRDLNQALQELGAFIKAKKVAVAGPPMAIYKSPPGPKWRIEACWPIQKAPTAAGPFKTRRLAGGLMAVLTLRGPYRNLNPVYMGLWKWINQQGYEPAGPPREVYVAMPPVVTDPKKFVTLIVWPVKKVRCSPK
jgi:effector-binding domain-containing protein